MHKTENIGLVWFRRDLRAHDHAALSHALRECGRVYGVFVLDRDILTPLARDDRRVEFIRESLVDLDMRLRALARQPTAGLIVRHGTACDEIVALARRLQVHTVYANHDDEPAALMRDAAAAAALRLQGVGWRSFKDHVLLERSEVLTHQGRPYSVFTPYKKAWLRQLDDTALRPHPVEPYVDALAPLPDDLRGGVPTLPALGFRQTNLAHLRIATGSAGGQQMLEDFFPRLDDYHRTRDFPAVKGPSYLGVHLRFGTVSVRQLASMAWHAMQTGSAGAACWLNELIWRDFYAQVLHHHPEVVTRSFKPEYDRIEWETGSLADAHFTAWCEGQTGYPLVDAAMAQLNQTGYMHNRLRMLTASFLCKDLGLDWRRGERYFAEKLNDYDLASNNGGWQWASSSGCDAQPYFRIFNPVSQSERFDPEGRFIRRYLPHLAELPTPALHAPWTLRSIDHATLCPAAQHYPAPLVDHAVARRRTLARYAVVRKAQDTMG